MARNANVGDVRHAASSIQVEELLNARHVDYRFEPNLDIEAIIDADGHQVRLIEHRAPSEMVARYTQQMKAGAVFPAIVVNERNELIDGNTRRRASLKAGRRTIAAYICRDLTPVQARSLSVELNQANGLPMDEEELHEYVRSAVRDGQQLDTKACARITGVRPATLDRWRSQALFEQRAGRCGIRATDVALLPDGVQAALNGIRLTSVFIEASELAVAARMSASAAKALVTRINAAPSEGEALQVVAAERDALSDVIRSIASGFAARRKAGNRSSMHVSALLRFEPDDLLQVSPDRREEAVARLRQLRDHVDRALVFADSRWPATTGSSAEANIESDAELCVQGGIRV